MRKISFLVPFLLIQLLNCYGLMAQAGRIGYVNYQLIYEQWPEADLTGKELAAVETRARAELQQKRQAVDQQYEAYNRLNRMDPQVTQEGIAKKQAALMEDTKALQALENKKQQEVFQAKETRSLQLNGKISKAIQAVAQEKGYHCVMDVGTLAYYTKADEITTLVLDKLKVQ